MITSILALALISNPFNSDEALHAVGHTGGSYMLTHGGEVVCKKITGKEHKVGCLVGSVVTTVVVGTAKELVLDRGESKQRHAKGFIEDAIGIGAAVTFITIDW
jgi:hypothetical protein